MAEKSIRQRYLQTRGTGMRLTEKAMYMLNPEVGKAIYRQRALNEMSEAAKKLMEYRMSTSSGYGAHGANKSKTSMLGWLNQGGSPEDDVDLNTADLRQRARDLYAAGGIGRSAPATLTTNVVGAAIIPKPQIDGEALNMTDEKCREWERNTMREFKLWADSVYCDAQRAMNFWAMQELAFRSMLISGDVFALFSEKKNITTPYSICLRLLEADRVCTPQTSGDSEAKRQDNGGRIVDGIEVDADGSVVKYHIAKYHPLQMDMPGMNEWIAIDAFAPVTGMPNILHVATWERPEQHRGVPFISATIEQIKQMDRYNDSELAAAIVGAMLTAFITSEQDDGRFGLSDAVTESERVSNDNMHIELAPGAVYELPPGKKIEKIDPRGSNTVYPDFMKALQTLTGSTLEIPAEVLMKRYETSYTSARAALLDFWRVVKKYRKRFNDAFNQPVYEQWLAEAVALGRIDAPGFFDDPAVRKAWCGCSWMGSNQGHVNPVQEANAAAIRIQNNISTEEQEAAEYDGGDWDTIVQQRIKEAEKRAEIGKAMTQEKETKE